MLLLVTVALLLGLLGLPFTLWRQFRLKPVSVSTA